MGTVRGPGPRPSGGCLTDRVSAPPFAVEARKGPPRVLLSVVAASAPTAVVCEPTSGALVLGSTQDGSAVDLERSAAAGLEVLRRRSGGGAVIVRPGAQVWIDVFVPRGDPRFAEDVQAAFAFVGEAWRAALAACVPEEADSLAVVESGEAVATRWSRTFCFAGLGAGEVTLGGRKLVGISQRRDRVGAWFHSMAMLDFDPLEPARLFGLGGPEGREAGDRLAAAAASVPGGRSVRAALVSAVLQQLS